MDKKLYYWIEDIGSAEFAWDNTKLCWKQESGAPRLHLSSIPRTNYREYIYTDGPRIPMPQETYLRDIFIDDKVTIPSWSTETFKGCKYVHLIHFNVETEISETIGTETVKRKTHKSQAFNAETKYDYHGEELWIG